MATINNYIDRVLLYCGFNSSPNRKYISDNGFELFKGIMSLNDKDIGNLSKGFS